MTSKLEKMRILQEQGENEKETEEAKRRRRKEAIVSRSSSKHGLLDVHFRTMNASRHNEAFLFSRAASKFRFFEMKPPNEYYTSFINDLRKTYSLPYKEMLI